MPSSNSLRAAVTLLAIGGLGACTGLAGLDGNYVVGEADGTGGTSATSTGTAGTGGAGAASGTGAAAGAGATGGSGAAGGAGAAGGTGAAGGGGGGSLDYPTEVLADQPMAYWRFGEANGPTAFDSSGNHRHALYSGKITYGVTGALAGDADTAVQFPGGEADVSHAFAFDDFTGTDPYTLETWFKADQYDSAYRHLFNKDFTGGNGRHNIGLFVTTGEQLGFERIIASTKHQAAAPLPTVGIWTHIVGTYDGANLRLYVDNVVIQTTPDNRPQDPKPVPSFIGAKWPAGQVLYGSLDEFAIYDYALPPARVAAHYHAGITK